MTLAERFAPAFAALDEADEAVRELHAGCCQPLRSPRMETLANTLDAARGKLGDLGDDPVTASVVIAILEDAGSQLGHLQVACCAPARTKLYSATLENLAQIQRLLTKSYALEH